MSEETFLVWKGKQIALTPYGFLIDAEDWSKELAQHLAVLEQVPELSEEHWHVILYLRDYYRQFKVAPMGRRIAKDTGLSLERLKELFPSGPARGACRIAGLPKPVGCF
ncbi:MAG: TusE/DsrC/DsvC family sulfur relay protein [Syntrophotaleaceae bacterium]